MLEFTKTEKGKAFEVFNESIHNEITRLNYNHSLYEFFKFSKCETLDKLTKLPTKTIQEKLKAWVIKLKATGIKSSSVKTKLAGVELFLDMNEVIYHKRVIRRLLETDKNGSFESPSFTTEEINRMLESTTKLRTKALIHFLSSTGVRPASIVDPVLKRKHIEEMPHGCKAIRIYDESNEGYWAFLTPESSLALDTYLNSRKLDGETFTDESPIFANMENVNNRQHDHLSTASLYQILSATMKQAGIVRIKKGYRYDKPLTYGFRKRFNKILKLNNEVNSNVAEKIFGHSNGLDGVYLKPTKEECFKEFLKAIPDLTINQTEKLKVEKDKLQIELSEKDTLKQDIAKLKEDYELLADVQANDRYIIERMIKEPAIFKDMKDNISTMQEFWSGVERMKSKTLNRVT